MPPDGDARFPPIDPKVWREISRESGARGPGDKADFAFIEYERAWPGQERPVRSPAPTLTEEKSCPD
jgi:hypothetical protein